MGPRARYATLLFIDAAELPADARALDALARLALIARRHGCEPRLLHVTPQLRELIEFAGLGEALPGAGLSPRSTAPRC